MAALHFHFLRDCLGHARQDQHGLLAALSRPIFQADSAEQARQRLGEAIVALEQRLPKVAGMLADAEEDILAIYSFPAAHWPKLRSTNPPERFNKEIGQRTDVVGIFPDDRSLIRLVGMLCLELTSGSLAAATCQPPRWSRSSRTRLHRDDTIDQEEVRESPQPEQLPHHRRTWAPTPTPRAGT